MIPFQFHSFWRLLITSGPMEAADWRARLHRVRFFIFFPLFQLCNSFFLSLDYLFFRFKDIPIKKPVFVVSPPRSGSTLMQRLLARDAGRFSSFALWQVIFPALWFQFLIRALGQSRVGDFFKDQLARFQTRLFSKSDRFHKIRLEAVEEDEVLFLHACASEMLANAFPIPEIWREYRLFDQLPDHSRLPLMLYYRRCIQRHLLFQGNGRFFLSKNPPFCHKMRALKEAFPDARFILLLRHPEECIGSVLSMLHAFRSSIGLKAKSWKHENQDPEIIRFSVDCYRHALAALAGMPTQDYRIIRYDDLIRRPRVVIEDLYAHFEIDLSDTYRDVLDDQERQAASHQSAHRHRIEDFGLCSADVEALLPEIYERFGFERRSLLV